MQCPKCHAENPEQAKFCLECGAKLQVVCPQCGAALPPAAKFCLECGAKLVASPPPPSPVAAPDLLAERLMRLVPKEYAERLLATRGQAGGDRRLVTILFSDVKGSTAMAEKLDPEEVMEVMNGAFEALIPPIYRHEGTLARLMGDAILAFFGAPLSHEDDPERAIRAALEIQESARTYAQRLEWERSIQGFSVRVGINTGLVVAGEVGTDLRVEYTAMGDAINLAARMEQNAPPGGILITHDTYRHVRGVFDVAPQPPLAAQGKAEPVQTYLVERARPRAFRVETRGVEGVETRMIGRDAELKRLQDAFYMAVDEGELQMVTVTGEAGVGKSRLLYEFDVWSDLLAQRFYYFKGRVTQERQSLPYALLHDVIAYRFDIRDTDPLSVVWAKMEQGMAATKAEPDAEMRAHLIGQLLGWNFANSPHVRAIAGDAQQLRDRALISLGDYLKELAARQPVLILLEDLHWADDASLDALNRLFGMLRESAVLVLCAARPALFERRPHWGEGQLFHSLLTLSPLSKRDSRKLVDEILQKAGEVPAALRDLVVSGAEGNPFYVEELVKMLIEEGVIVTGAERWTVRAERLAELEVPPTLAGVLQARLDGLPAAERLVLQQASIVGRLFWDVVVARIGAMAGAGEALEAEALHSALMELRAREMIYRRETSAFEGAEEFLFKHATLREVTYEGVLKRVRQVYHGLVADWLIEAIDQAGGRAAEHTGLIAEHLERAGRQAEALEYLRRAGEEAAQRYANAEALQYLTRALAMAPASGLCYRLLLVRERIYDLQTVRPAQAADLEEMERLAAELDATQPQEGNSRRAEVALRRVRYLQIVGETPAALLTAQAALGWARAAGDVVGEAEAHLKWGQVLMSKTDYAAGRPHLEEALALARDSAVPSGTRAREVEANSLYALGFLTGHQGHAVESREYGNQALRAYREIGDRRGEIRVLNSLGADCSNRGDYVGDRTYYEQALGLCREIGDRWGESQVIGNLGYNCANLGEYAEALGFYEEVLRICEEIGNRRAEQAIILNLGNICGALGDHAGARTYFEEALHKTRDIGDRRMEGYALTGLGNALAGLGSVPEAADAFEQAITLRRELGEDHLATESLAGLARLKLAQGDQAGALECVETILAHLAGGGSLDDTEEPLRIYLTCYQVLGAAGDRRALAILETAYTLLQQRAAAIRDEGLRESYLNNVPWHREIEGAAAKQH